MSDKERLMTPADRLKSIMEEMSINYRELGDLAGVTRQAARSWCEGATKDLRMENLFTIQDKTGYSARWIATGRGPKKTYQIDSLAPDEVEILLAYRSVRNRQLSPAA